eukprot:s562_g16.t3
MPKKKRRVPPITPEEEKLAEDALFGQGSGDEVVASRFSVEVTRRQLECLRPGEWLNDEVINFYYKLLQERSKTIASSPKSWFTNSFFWPKLSGNNKDASGAAVKLNKTEYNYKEVRRWTIKAKVDIFDMDYVIFPMNIAETHWSMGAIDMREKGFRYFDSMFSNPPSNFVAFLRRYLADEHKDLKLSLCNIICTSASVIHQCVSLGCCHPLGLLDSAARVQAKKSKDLQGVGDWKLLIPEPPVPQQRNGYDCGVFTCFFADCLSAGKSLGFDQEDMPTLRKRIAARIMKADEKNFLCLILPFEMHPVDTDVLAEKLQRLEALVHNAPEVAGLRKKEKKAEATQLRIELSSQLLVPKDDPQRALAGSLREVCEVMDRFCKQSRRKDPEGSAAPSPGWSPAASPNESPAVSRRGSIGSEEDPAKANQAMRQSTTTGLGIRRYLSSFLSRRNSQPAQEPFVLQACASRISARRTDSNVLARCSNPGSLPMRLSRFYDCMHVSGTEFSVGFYQFWGQFHECLARSGTAMHLIPVANDFRAIACSVLLGVGWQCLLAASSSAPVRSDREQPEPVSSLRALSAGAVDAAPPFYLTARHSYPYPDWSAWHGHKQLQSESLAELHEVEQNQSTWILPHKLTTSVRNHDSILLEVEEQHFLVTVLGRWSRFIQVMDLSTGQQWSKRTRASDPEGDPLDNLNHVYTVLVDKLGGAGKEVWLPCGFRGDQVNREYSIKYMRILDLETLELRTGPKLPFAGGACTAEALEIIPDEPPMICSFGGTDGHHNSGIFQPYATCYDRLRERFWFPFGKMPYGMDHASIVVTPAGVCGEQKQNRSVIILNYRIVPYGSQRPEMLAHDLPEDGWTAEELSELSMEDPGEWYIYHNGSFTPADPCNSPRDASGMATANGGRLMLNFGGIYYTHDKNGHPVGHRFSAIRSFDVCEKSWTIEGDLGMDTFALQTAASQKLQIAVTCGGESVERFLNRNGNQPWCIVHRPRHDLVLANRHGGAATHGFPSGFVPGKVQVTGKSTILVPVPTATTMTTTDRTTTTTATTTTTTTATDGNTTTTEDAGDDDEDDVGKLPSSAIAGTVSSAVLGLAATHLLPVLIG